jgi:hypothetical protein
MLPTQDPFAAVTAPSGKQRTPPSVPWLRVELSSGRRFEIAPVEQYFEDERYPRLAIAIEEVQNFADARPWPGGPALEWVMPNELQDLPGQSIRSAAWIRRSEAEPPEGYEAKLSNGAVLQIRHSETSPMSLEFTVR